MERKITVCGVSRIAGILTDENSDGLLREVSGKKYAEIDRIAASRRTAPAIREFVRPIGMKAPANRSVSDSQIDSNPRTDHPAPIGTGPAIQPNPGAEKTEYRYEIRFSASEGFFRKLKRAQAICSRRPDLESVFEKALDELLDRYDPERREVRRKKRKSARRVGSGRESEKSVTKGAANSRVGCEENSLRLDDEHGRSQESSGISRIEKSNNRSRHIPAGIRDVVFTRDDGRCTYVGKNGVQCGATVYLQIDHIRPFCLGGEHTLENLRLLCGKHNRLAARELSRST